MTTPEAATQAKDPTPQLVTALLLLALAFGTAIAPLVMADHRITGWFGLIVFAVTAATAWHASTACIKWRVYRAVVKLRDSMAAQEMATFMEAVKQAKAAQQVPDEGIPR
jgi:hypothetical protein